MYGHICETGGTREVLPPRSLKRFMFKVCLNLKIDLRSGQKSTTNKIKELRAALESASRRLIVGALATWAIYTQGQLLL